MRVFVFLFLLLTCLGSCKETKTVNASQYYAKRNPSGWPGTKNADDVFATSDTISAYDSLAMGYKERLLSLPMKVTDTAEFEQN